jgi:2-dehydropantoate 2-reductase
MRYVIVGPGALGSLIAVRLCLASLKAEGTGNDSIQIHLLDYKPDRAVALNEEGLNLEESGQVYRCQPSVTADPKVVSRSDVVFFCVKSTAVAPALSRIKSYLSPTTLLLAMQNGIGHLDEISSLNCQGGVGVTTEGATLTRPGSIRHGGKGMTRLGVLTPGSKDVRRLLEKTTELFNTAGLVTSVTNTPLKYIWAKLFVNVGINALSALHRCPNGKLLESESARHWMTKAVREAESIAREKGIPVKDDPVEETFKVCVMTAKNISSMHQDVLHGRLTEIDAINGAVVAEGKRLGIATPVNIELVRKIKQIEASYTL